MTHLRAALSVALVLLAGAQGFGEAAQDDEGVALVTVVGCLRQDSGDLPWVLERATAGTPARTAFTSQVELETSAEQPLGSLEYRLIGVGEFVAGLRLKFGPVAASFDGRLALSNIVDNRAYTITFEGIGGVAGSGRGIADVRLEPHTAGTLLVYTVEASVGGRIARVGQVLVDRIARKMIRDFFRRFEELNRALSPE